jgi:putative addiction module component (TIGR02574 family)
MGEIKTDDIKAMTVEQRLDLIERIWDTLAETPEAIPVPDWHRRVLEERQQAFEEDPDAGASWDEAVGRITRRP